MTGPEGELLGLTKDILDFLRLRIAFDFTRVHVGGVRTSGRGTRKNVEMSGFADLEVVFNGRVGYIELKAQAGKLRPDQEKFRDTRTRAGAKFTVAKSTEDVIRFLIQEMEIPHGCFEGFKF